MRRTKMGIENTEEESFDCDKGWAEVELGSVYFGDARLNKRFLKVAETLSAQPQAPINQASEDWAAAKAAYRLFSNKKVTEEKLFKVHQERTKQRMIGEEVVLAIQDTTYLNYDEHDKCAGLGSIGTEELKGIILHHTFAISTSGVPLGLITQNKNTRVEVKRLSDKEKSSLPIEKKESYRWIEALRKTVEIGSGAKKVVTVCDREADIYEFLMEAENLKTHYLIRSSANRNVEGEYIGNLVEAVEKEDLGGMIEVKIPSRNGKKGRTAEVEIKFTEVTLCPPRRMKSAESIELKPLKVSVVLATEKNTPEGVEALRWILLTNVKVNSLEDAVERICWYRARWHIEVYHKVFKSGCKVEDCRLQTVERLNLYLTLFGIIAWRIYWFTHINRAAPNASVEVVLTKRETKVLTLIASNKKGSPVKIKTVRQAVTEIAKLGGFLARRHDGLPGVTVIWRGWHRFSDAVDIYDAMHSQRCG